MNLYVFAYILNSSFSGYLIWRLNQGVLCKVLMNKFLLSIWIKYAVLGRHSFLFPEYREIKVGGDGFFLDIQLMNGIVEFCNGMWIKNSVKYS